MLIPHLLIIDDHALFRSGLRLVLHNGFPEARISEAASLEDAMRLSEEPSVLLLDIQLDGLNGIDGMAVLARKWPGARIIILSADDTDDTIREATRRGAAAFVSKAATAEHILGVIRDVSGGLADAAPARAGADAPADKPQFTPRQYEVLDLLSQGLTNKAIGRRLNLSENTIRGHVQAILTALDVDNRSEAAFAARRRGLVG